MFPCAPPISKPTENFRTKMFGTLESSTKNNSLSSFLQETPLNRYQRTNKSISEDKNRVSGRSFLPFQENEWEGKNQSFQALETFLSSIDFSSTYIQFENQVSPPVNTKESPCFIRKLHKSRDFKSEEKSSNLSVISNSFHMVHANRRLQFSNYKDVKTLDAIPEIQSSEVEDFDFKYKRSRGKSVDSVQREKGVYRRKAEAGMFRKKNRINEIERIIEEAEELSSHRGIVEEERIKKNECNLKKDSDDSEEEWRCTSSSLSIYSKLSKENSTRKNRSKESQDIDQEILDFIKKRILKKGDFSNQSTKTRDFTRESFSQELAKMKDVIENALVLYQDPANFNLVDSP